MFGRAALAATFLLLTTTASFAEGRFDVAAPQPEPDKVLVSMDTAAPVPAGRQTLNSSEISAIQYREPADTAFASSHFQPIDR